MGFLSNIFGKQTCVLCGKECGPLKRDKLRSGEFVCSECREKSSKYVRLSELSLDELKAHMEYMDFIRRLDETVFSKPEYSKYQLPSSITSMGIQFCDELGMLKILNRSVNGIDDIIRYDQIASYDSYKETEEEEGKEPKIKEAGIKLTLVQPRQMNDNMMQRGIRVHPYIKRELKIVFAKSNVKSRATDANLAKDKLHNIFGEYDSNKSLLGFGMSKAEKRDLMGTVGMIKAMGTVAKAAASGNEELSAEQQAQLKESFDAVNDAQTGGLAVYSRRADEAETKVQQEQG